MNADLQMRVFSVAKAVGFLYALACIYRNWEPACPNGLIRLVGEEEEKGGAQDNAHHEHLHCLGC